MTTTPKFRDIEEIQCTAAHGGLIYLELPGLAYGERPDSVLLLQILLAVDKCGKLLRDEILPQINNPLDRANFAEAILVADQAPALESNTIVRELGDYLPGLSGLREITGDSLLHAVCFPIYQHHALILEKLPTIDIDRAVELAEALVMCEALLDRDGILTDLEEHSGTIEDPTPVMVACWALKAKRHEQALSKIVFLADSQQ